MKDSAQIHAPENVEELIEESLTQTYGKVRENVTPGLKWLFGTFSYPGYFDHPEYRIKDGKRTMIARPYGIGMEGLQELVELARKKQLDVSIDAPSNYNYKTLLVIVTEWTSSELNENRHQERQQSYDLPDWDAVSYEDIDEKSTSENSHPQ